MLNSFAAKVEESGSWWEPGTPGVLDIGDISVFLGAIIAFSTVFMMVSRWWMKALRKIIHEEITVATEPIHPNSNGGLCLADVARKTTALEVQITQVEKYNKQTYELVLGLTASLDAVEEKVEEKIIKPKPRSRASKK